LIKVSGPHFGCKRATENTIIPESQLSIPHTVVEFCLLGCEGGKQKKITEGGLERSNIIGVAGCFL
jgi:hypothetical protein